MPNFLETILAHKAQEIERQRQRCPEPVLQEQCDAARPPISFVNALSQEGLALIAEIKKASPSAGIIRKDFDPKIIAESYVNAGANAISMLTDEKFFQGSLTYIEHIREFVPIPILRKDFIIDPYQLLEARAAGADAVLMIVAALPGDTLAALLKKTRELHLGALVEVHSAPEMQIAVDVGATIIGINNRNLETFKIDLATTEQLAPLAPSGTILVGESGLHTKEDIQRMVQAGVNAVLVGTHFMKYPDPGLALKEFKQFCGK